MRTSWPISCLPLLFAWSVATAAQDVASPAARFRAATSADKRETLAKIIRHQLPDGPEDIVAIIRIALKDSDVTIRETALAAVVSRAAGPRFTRSKAVADDWRRDRAAIQTLRPLMIETLRDRAENVRLQAVASLASLDFSMATRDPALTLETQQALIDRFYTEESAAVRAKIAAGFGTDRTADSAAVRELLSDAFHDPDRRVRHAASSGAAKLGPLAIPLLVQQLGDQDRSVRMQAAAVLAKAGPEAAVHLAEIEEALKTEQDSAVRQQLRIAVSAITPKK
jgi:HEAT repeat protein